MSRPRQAAKHMFVSARLSEEQYTLVMNALREANNERRLINAEPLTLSGLIREMLVDKATQWLFTNKPKP